MHNWLRRNVFHNSKSVFMWLSICGFGMIIGTHPHLSEALGSSSQTWFVILNSIRHPELDSGQMNSLSSYQRCGIHLVPGSSPGWQIPRASLERGCVHHSLFIVHYSLFIMHYETQFGVSLLWIIKHYIMFARACVRGAEPFEPILRWKAALYGKKAVLYGEKSGGLACVKRRF